MSEEKVISLADRKKMAAPQPVTKKKYVPKSITIQFKNMIVHMKANEAVK